MSDRKQIEALAQVNPVVRACLGTVQHGGLSYEQALEQMVIALVEQNTGMAKLIERFTVKGLPPTVIVTTQEQADQIHSRYASGEPLPGASHE